MKEKTPTYQTHHQWAFKNLAPPWGTIG